MNLATERAALIATMERIFAVCKDDNRPMNEVEEKAFDDAKNSITKIDKTLGGMDFVAGIAGPHTRPLGGGNSLSKAVIADNFVQRLFAQGQARLDVPGFNVKAVGSTQASSPAPGFTVVPDNFGLINSYHGVVYRLLNALATTPVSGNAVFYSRVHYGVVGSPTIPDSGNAAKKVQELTAKPESILATEDVTQTIDTWAHYVKSSKQVLADLTGLRTAIDNLLLNGLLDKMDVGVFGALTTNGNFTTFTPGSALIQDEIASLATTLLTAGAQGVKIALNPATMLKMRQQKTSGSGEYLGLPDIPATLVSSATVPVNKLLAFTSQGAVWGEREGASVIAGLDSDDFTKNKVTLLCEARGSVLVFDPKFVRYGNSNT